MNLGVKRLTSTGMIIGVIFTVLGLAIYLRITSKQPVSYQVSSAYNCLAPAARANSNFNIMNLNSKYQINTCTSSSVTDRMYFTDMQLSVGGALSAASDMANTLKQFSDQQVSPIIIVEPTDDNSNPLDLNQLAKGVNVQALEAYFNQLRKLGITDKMMGLWIPYPEPDQPDWLNMSVANFGSATNIYLSSLRRVFPTAKTGILLDSETGNSERETDVQNYAASIDKSLVDVAGLQGFPWPPSEDNGDTSSDDPTADFLPAEMATKLATILGTKQILLNTGSYGSYINSQGTITVASVEGRTLALAIIAEQAKILKSNGYALTINIFEQNKLSTPEGIDWSYNSASSSGSATDYAQLINQLVNSGAKVSSFGTDR